ncbi:MAG: tetratricopeptide repeat protein [bacterium]
MREEAIRVRTSRSINARHAGAAGAALFLGFAGFLVFGAAPSLYWGDSAEFTTVACTLGTSHSPGYPLMSLAGRAAAALPLAPFPFRAHFVSIIFSSVALVLLFYLMLTLTGRLFASAAGAALIATTPAFVKASLFAEVYGLHACLFGAALLLISRHDAEGRRTAVYAAFFVLALGLAHHVLMTFVLAGALVYIFFQPERGLRAAAAVLFVLFAWYVYALFRSYGALGRFAVPLGVLLWAAPVALVLYVVYSAFDAENRLKPLLREVSCAVFAFAAGLLVYACVPLFSARGPGADWWDPETPANFASLLLLRGYSATLPGDVVELFRRMKPEEIFAQFPPVLVPVAALGFVFLGIRNVRLFLTLLVASALNFAGSVLIEHGKPESLRIPVYLAVSVFASYGVAWLLSLRILRGGGWRRMLAAPVYAFVAAVLVLRAPNLGSFVMNGSDHAHRLGAGIVRSLDPGSIIFIGLQTPSILQYFEECENRELREKGAAIIPVSFLSFEWKVRQLKGKYARLDFPPFVPEPEERDLFEARSDSRIRYAAQLMRNNIGATTDFFTDFLFIPPELGIATVPAGLIYRLVPAEVVAGDDEFFAEDSPVEWETDEGTDAVSLENIASIHNERGTLFMHYGVSAGSGEALGRAVREFDRALELKPDYPDPLANKGTCLLALGEFEKAVALQKKAVRLAPDRPELYDQLAATYFRRQTRRSTEAAIKYWLAAAALDPENPRYAHNLGTAYVGVQNTQAAKRFYQLAIVLKPSYFEAQINLSRLYLAEKNCPKAIEHAELAKTLVPDRMDVRVELATDYHECGMMRLFEIELKSLISDFPADNLAFFHNLGVLYRNIGRIESALEVFEEARKMDPGYRLTDMFGSLTGCDDAVTALERVVALEPGDPDVRLLLASRYYNCGMEAEAREALLDAKRRFPRHPGAASLLKQMETP